MTKKKPTQDDQKEKRKAGRRSDIDWEAIEKDYRIGHLSVADIAKKHRVALSGLKRKAKLAGWTRDLTPIVQIATKAAITQERADHAKKLAEQAPEIGREIGRAIQMSANSGLDDNVAAAAALGTMRNRFHADIAASGLDVARGLMDEMSLLNNADLREGLRAFMAGQIDDGDDEARKKLDASIRKLFGVENRAKNLDTILAAVAKGVAIDRKANGLDDKDQGKEEGFEELLKRIHSDE
jgi:hypothetical protein